VTAGTTTGRDAVLGWGLPNVETGLSPLDLGWITGRFIRRNQVRALIIVENELWPARILATQAAGLPVVMLNARLSASSMRTWQRFPQTARRMLSDMDAILPQDQASSDRIKELGAPTSIIATPFNLKSLYRPNTVPLPLIADLFSRETTLLAAATHEGEDEIVLQAFAKLRQEHSDLRLIIAPRHPDRGAAIKQISERFGYQTALRSGQELEDFDVFVADSLGEMHIWFQISAAAFIGGSLVPKGGHTPFEPAAYGCPIIHGPSVENFVDGYAEIAESQQIWRVTDANSLATAFREAMQTRPAPRSQQDDGSKVLEALDRALGTQPLH